MKYYNSKNNNLIDSSDLIAMYGTDSAIPELGIYSLSVQPNYVPVGFNDLGNGTWYPVESYDSMRTKSLNALVASGMTSEEALEVLS